MTYTFSVNEETSVPRISIDGKRLAVVGFALSFQTKSDQANSGYYTITASGYLHGEMSLVLRTYRIDLRTKECVEV